MCQDTKGICTGDKSYSCETYPILSVKKRDPNFEKFMKDFN